MNEITSPLEKLFEFLNQKQQEQEKEQKKEQENKMQEFLKTKIEYEKHNQTIQLDYEKKKQNLKNDHESEIMQRYKDTQILRDSIHDAKKKLKSDYKAIYQDPEYQNLKEEKEIINNLQDINIIQCLTTTTVAFLTGILTKNLKYLTASIFTPIIQIPYTIALNTTLNKKEKEINKKLKDYEELNENKIKLLKEDGEKIEKMENDYNNPLSDIKKKNEDELLKLNNELETKLQSTCIINKEIFELNNLINKTNKTIQLQNLTNKTNKTNHKQIENNPISIENNKEIIEEIVMKNQNLSTYTNNQNHKLLNNSVLILKTEEEQKQEQNKITLDKSQLTIVIKNNKKIQ